MLVCSVVFGQVVFSQAVAASTQETVAPSLEEIWKLIQQQQTQIEKLESELLGSQRRLEEAQIRWQADNQAQSTRLAQTEEALEATVTAVEAVAFNDSGKQTNLGGYGELHYNNLDNGKEIDLHRFVMFFSHQFNQELSFYSELEVEHSIAGDGQPGEVEIEQAFIQWDYADNHRTRMGVYLVPVGILNETHEPDTFYGVERNPVEKQIIPSTWWEGGAVFDGEITPGWGYNVAAHSGLNLDTDNASASKRSSIRSARQKVAKANADSPAFTARIRFNGIAGLQWNTSLQYQSDLTQDDADGIGISGIDATLFETNLSFQRAGFSLRALYARWDINDKIELLNPGSNEQVGWFVEPSYRFDKLGLFMRYSSYDLTAGSNVTSNEKSQFDVGVNYWLYDTVVLKADFQRQDNDNGKDIDGFNLGVGYSF